MDDAVGLVKRIDHTSLDVENPVVAACNVDSPEIIYGKESKAEWVGKDEQSIRELVNIEEVVPSWKEQLTLRGLIVSFLIGILFSIIVMNINLTTGIVPSMNISAGLVGFVLMRIWIKILEKIGYLTTPFTKQENTVIQTCAVACYTISLAGGFGSYMSAMDSKTYKRAGIDSVGNTWDTVKEPGIGWMTGFLFLVTFVGILVLVPLRKVLIGDYKLTYPSGTATAVLINGIHDKDKSARKQVRCFGKYFTFSFLWGFFKWFFGAGHDCGFVNFPIFGLRAWKQGFYFDFNLTFIGAGMIFPHLVNISMLLGGILSWGIMWPLISKHEGDWYSNNLPQSSIKGLNGYKLFVCVAIILGDGLYNFVKILWFTGSNIYTEWKKVKRQNGAIIARRKTHFQIAKLRVVLAKASMSLTAIQ